MVLNGIDIASYQAGLHAGTVKGDFVIIKATEGLSYVNPQCDKHYQQAKKAGKLLGVYHFAQTNDAVAEADYFLKNIKNYIGEAMLVLDYEMAAVNNGPAWVLRFLNRVKDKTGVKPLIYMSLSVTNEQNWSSVVKGDYGLWVAQYNSNGIQNGFAHPTINGKVGYWPFVAIHQYSSNGRLPGYNGSLDMDYFNGDSKAWKSYAKSSKGSAPTPAPKPERVYIVKSTDYSLGMIAQSLGVSLDSIVRLNNIKNPNLIYAGQKLKY